MIRVFKPIGSVYFSLERSTSKGHKKLFQLFIPFKIAIAAKDGFIIGIISLKKIPNSDAQSILPASISYIGIPVKYCLKKKIVDA